MTKTSKMRYLILLLIGFAFILSGCGDKTGSQKINFKSEYQAVFLPNGQVYFGKVEIGPDYVTLTDVFYIQSQVNQQTKEVTNILLKRGKEWHSPDAMYISKGAVALIEPVAADSQVAKLIKEAKSEGAKK
jgi:hypothetical protein